jgi:DNA-binding NtrC family response regulator
MTHVLIADDEIHTRISLTFILQSAGYLVTDAPDGREALDRILALQGSSHPVDMLILDIEMPGLTGWQLLDVLKNQNIYLPTIIITGFSDSRTGRKVPSGWHVEFIVKPFTPELLTTSVLRVLKEKKPLGGNEKDDGIILKEASSNCEVERSRYSSGLSKVD